MSVAQAKISWKVSPVRTSRILGCSPALRRASAASDRICLLNRTASAIEGQCEPLISSKWGGVLRGIGVTITNFTVVAILANVSAVSFTLIGELDGSMAMLMRR